MDIELGNLLKHGKLTCRKLYFNFHKKYNFSNDKNSNLLIFGVKVPLFVQYTKSKPEQIQF